MLVRENAPQGQAAPPSSSTPAPDLRYDPAVLRAGVSSFDWRDDAPNNAIGLNVPAVQRGRIRFFTPMPGVEGLVSFKEGGVAPFEFTGFHLRLVIDAPMEITIRDVLGVQTAIIPRGIQLAEIIARGRFNLRADKVDVLSDVPVAAIGAAAGLLVNGAPFAGAAINRGTDFNHGFPLPEPLQLGSTSPRLEAWIDLFQPDLAKLGAGVGIGVGAPWAGDTYWDPLGVLQVVEPLALTVALEVWGQRGLHIKAGQVPLAPGLPCYYPKGD